mmetsp:Transcript_76806/g.205194  ORF Transcript_76806/g.205194 Transcript_76806/m.205194 type:complete len:242 (-) Transcript_76806:201-926(-)
MQKPFSAGGTESNPVPWPRIHRLSTQGKHWLPGPSVQLASNSRPSLAPTSVRPRPGAATEESRTTTWPRATTPPPATAPSLSPPPRPSSSPPPTRAEPCTHSSSPRRPAAPMNTTPAGRWPAAPAGAPEWGSLRAAGWPRLPLRKPPLGRFPWEVGPCGRQTLCSRRRRRCARRAHRPTARAWNCQRGPARSSPNNPDPSQTRNGSERRCSPASEYQMAGPMKPNPSELAVKQNGSQHHSP